jgi:hypothetical protein
LGTGRFHAMIAIDKGDLAYTQFRAAVQRRRQRVGLCHIIICNGRGGCCGRRNAAFFHGFGPTIRFRIVQCRRISGIPPQCSVGGPAQIVVDRIVVVVTLARTVHGSFVAWWLSRMPSSSTMTMMPEVNGHANRSHNGSKNKDQYKNHAHWYFCTRVCCCLRLCCLGCRRHGCGIGTGRLQEVRNGLTNGQGIRGWIHLRYRNRCSRLSTETGWRWWWSYWLLCVRGGERVVILAGTRRLVVQRLHQGR